MSDTPNPGTREAIAAGCSCPVIDNGYGKGYMGGIKDENGNTLYIYMDGCQVHRDMWLLPFAKDEKKS